MPTTHPLHIAHARVSRSIGGTERYVLDLCRIQRQRGHAIDIILPAGSQLERRAHALQMCTIAGHIQGDINMFAPLFVAQSLRRSLPQVLNVHSHAMLCCLGGWLANVPVVATVHGLHQRRSYPIADHLIAVSTAVGDHLIAQGESPRRITVVRNGIDTDWFTPRAAADARVRLGLEPDGMYFATLSRLTPGKGLELLLDAFHAVRVSVPQARLLLVGEGRLELCLRHRVAQLGLDAEVSFLGFTDDVRPVLAAADCLLLPSEREGLGLVILEAMAMARAVIATNSGGPREIVQDGVTGLLVPPCDLPALTRAMLTMATQPAFTREAGCAGRRHVERAHALTHEADGVEDVYQQVLRKRGM